MKKFLLALLTVSCIVCVGMFAACEEGREFEGNYYEGKYYDITFEDVAGITYDCEIKSGAIVREGYTVKFSLDIDEDVIGEPKVKVNGKELKSDENGEYSFKMTKDTEVKIDGVYKQRYYKVVFDEGVGWLDFDCEIEDTTKLKAGEEIEFTLKLSPYYVQSGYDVMANTQVVEADENGKYKVAVTSDMTISVENLTLVENFTERDNGGEGTYENPFKISEPIDLYQLSQLINSEDYAYYGFNTAYYELVNDIDMQGEQLFVIGDMSSDYAYFAGTFNGNGHTISNYYIKDTIIDQSTYDTIFLPYVGLFGYAVAVSGKSPEIYNLNLKDFSIDVNASSTESMAIVGGVVGASIGANITACNVENGTISVVAHDGYFSYAGGIAGVHQSAFDENSIIYYATIVSCHSDVKLSASAGYAYAFGGIAGYMVSYEERATALVLNCYSDSDVAGAIYTGGIVGRAENNTSIISCYSTGNVSAASRISDGTSEVYATSYAGGITGYSDYNSIISDCFVEGSSFAIDKNGKYVYANSKFGKNNGGYAFAGEIAGAINETGINDDVISANKCIVLNCYGKSDNVEFNENFFKNTLGWDEADWVFESGKYPVVNLNETTKTFDITVNYGNNTVNAQSNKAINVSNTYIPMSYWYMLIDDLSDDLLISEYVKADNGNYSYGYFFDEDLTKQVPYSFVPTKDVTIYAGFADYSEVSGKYYIQAAKAGSGAYLELSADGKLKFSYGARKLESNYTYNGKELCLFDLPIAILGGYDNVQYDDGTSLKDYAETYYYTYKAQVNNGTMKIWDNLFYLEENKLCAVKEASGFVYGSYYDANNNEYVFNTDGTGYANGENFTFTVNGEKIKIFRKDFESEYALNDGLVTKLWYGNVSVYDNFKGVWETNANAGEKYTFDGKGGYVYKNAQGNETSGTYKISEGVLTTDSKYTFVLENGFINATFGENTEILYKGNSFVGTWFFNGKNGESMEITFDGLNSSNCGTANIVTENYEYDAMYETSVYGNKVSLNIYIEDSLFADLAYDADNAYLKGNVYSLETGNYIEDSVFCLYDDFKGSWISGSTITDITFNGLGRYALPQSAVYYPVKGSARVTLKNGKTSTVTYTFNHKNMNGTFFLQGFEYYFEYNRHTDSLFLIGEVGTNIEFTHYDEWHDIVLTTEDGVKYAFDGRGNLENGGTIKIGVKSYTYEGTSYGVLITDEDNNEYSRISIDTESGFYVETIKNGGTTNRLYVESDFTGEWLINKYNGELSIGKVNAYGKADGTYKGKAVKYTVEKDSAYFEYGETTIYLYIVEVGDEFALIIADENDNYTSDICIQMDKEDGWLGEYKSASNNGSIIFDGLGNSKAYNGTVILKDENGSTTNVYEYYFVNERLQIKASRSEKYFFVVCEETDAGAYKVGENYYCMKKIDYLCDVTITTETATYYFDGIGNLKITYAENDICNYTYEVTKANSASTIITIKITSGELNGKVAEIYYGAGAGKYTITFVEENTEA